MTTSQQRPGDDPRPYPGYRLGNGLRGLIIYGAGDAFAALILGEFSTGRLIGMAALGASLYALEIPNWFRYIDRRVPLTASWRSVILRTGLALLYFNPLWIARHLLFIALFSGDSRLIGWSLITTGLWSFLVNIPVTILANYWIQVRVSGKQRFTASALFSAGMAVYYAFSGVWFGRP